MGENSIKNIKDNKVKKFKKRDFSDKELKVLLDEDRNLTKYEYAFLEKKKKTLPIPYFRSEMFEAVSRKKRTKYSTPKEIYNDGDVSLSITHRLTQRHSDILTLLWTTCYISKPNEKGNYKIHLSLYDLAKKMGFKNPAKRTSYIRELLYDLKWTDLIVKNCKTQMAFSISILKDFLIDEKVNRYRIEIDSLNAKILMHFMSISISPTISQKIVDIDSKYPTLKSMIRRIITHKASDVGYSVKYLLDILGINKYDEDGNEIVTRTIQNNRSKFKKMLREHKELLESFNIRYDAEKEKVFYYKDLDGLEILQKLSNEPISSLIIEEIEKYLIKPEEVEEIKMIDNNFKISYEDEESKLLKWFENKLVKINHYLLRIEKIEKIPQPKEKDGLVIKYKVTSIDVDVNKKANFEVSSLDKLKDYIVEY